MDLNYPMRLQKKLRKKIFFDIIVYKTSHFSWQLWMNYNYLRFLDDNSDIFQAKKLIVELFPSFGFNFYNDFPYFLLQ